MDHSKISELGKVSPSAPEMEIAVLGACMLNKECLDLICSILKSEMFYKQAHQIIFEAIKTLHHFKQNVDILTVVHKLKSTNVLDKAGDAFYVTQLTNRIASAANVEMHARIIIQLYMKRCLIAYGTSILQRTYNEYEDVFELMDYSHKSIKEIDNLIPSERQKTNDEALVELNEDIASAETKGGIIGYSSGNKALDFALTGLRPGNKYVIAALPGEGKTSLAKSIALHLSTVENLPGVFFSMEMTHKQLLMVTLSQLHQISNEKIQRGQLESNDKTRISNTHLSHDGFWRNFNIDDEGGLDPIQIRRKISKYVKSQNIKWFVVDYLQLAKLKGKEHKGKTRENIVSDITAEIKNIAKEFNLIAFELSQLTKEAGKRDSKRPQLSDLKDSGAIEANADAVIFISRPEKHGINTVNAAPGFAELIIAKNRYGRIMSVAATYIPQFTQFKENEKGIELEVQPEKNETDF